ncbi:Antithrombin-III [Thelohanellus kitauei]|uniref:Antithrombin-III n=1 Tax=Thelohanellus kitauei TaxID=669202 RepID=A0A0C2MLI0_THEKT|nr:Antithrombin-III [Thelohanellus kitauei]
MSINRVNSFTSTLLNQLYASQNKTGNIALSGISLYVLLGAIDVGLQGRSHNQLYHFLGEKFDDFYDTDNWRSSDTAKKWSHLRELYTSLSIAHTVLFYSCGIHDHYKQISDSIFTLKKIKIDFSNRITSALKMNKWMSQRTFGAIQNVFDQSTLTDNILVFINTLFFRANWRNKFNPELTKQEIFYEDNGQQLQVAMMNQEIYQKIFDSPHYIFKILFRPFTENIYSAIILPRDGHAVNDVLQILNLDQLYNYFKLFTWKYVKLKLPKFKILSQKDFVHTLKKFKVADMFDRNHSDFGWMTNQKVFIGNLIQVSNIAIDESGLTDAHGTISMEESASEPYEFYVTKPFLFLVFSPSDKLVIFSAIVKNPSPS